MALTKRGTAPNFTQSQYDFEYRVFPENLGDEENSHYMIININVPVYPSEIMDGPLGSFGLLGLDPNIMAKSNLPTGTDAGIFSKIDQLRQADRTTLSAAANPLNAGTGGGNFGRLPSRRITESIALHMPNGGLVFTDDNKYEEVSMTAMGGSILSSVARVADKFFGTEFAAPLLDAIGGIVKNGAKVAAMPINPMVEVIFATRPQRQWMFEVLLVPRTQKEAETIKEIIYTLRYHAAPELGITGLTFKPPAEFDITFFRNGEENQYLPKINTCVLEKIDVDYAPADGKYSTFKNGAPIAARLSLGFRELEITHKARVYQGF